MTLLEAYEAIVSCGAAPAFEAHVSSMHRRFEERTGAFTPEDSWFEARSRAFWDDAVTGQGFAADARASLGDAAQALVPVFARAHRGLFVADREREGARRRLLRDVWSGASFLVDEIDDGVRDALSVASAPFDARLVGAMLDGVPRVALLPGAVFHPEEAIAPIDTVLEAARAAELSTETTLDALLRMERSLRSLARMKAAYAYRASALANTKREG